MVTAWECLHAATMELVRSTPIKTRLATAYRIHLSGLREEQLPREIREDFARVTLALTCVKPQPGEDRVAASTRKMSGQEADECATLIVQIFCALSAAGQGQVPKPVASVVVPIHPEIDVPATIASVSRA